MNNERHILGKYPEEKLGILDSRATLDNGTIIWIIYNRDTKSKENTRKRCKYQCNKLIIYIENVLANTKTI